MILECIKMQKITIIQKYNKIGVPFFCITGTKHSRVLSLEGAISSAQVLIQRRLSSTSLLRNCFICTNLSPIRSQTRFWHLITYFYFCAFIKSFEGFSTATTTKLFHTYKTHLNCWLRNPHQETQHPGDWERTPFSPGVLHFLRGVGEGITPSDAINPGSADHRSAPDRRKCRISGQNVQRMLRESDVCERWWDRERAQATVRDGRKTLMQIWQINRLVIAPW